MANQVEIEFVPNTEKLEATIEAIASFLDDLKADFYRFRTSLEFLREQATD